MQKKEQEIVREKVQKKAQGKVQKEEKEKRKKYFEFVLEEREYGEEGGFDRLLFRFYPERTRAISYNYDPPKTKEEVCYRDYDWKILRQRRSSKNKSVHTYMEFDTHVEENSIFEVMADYLEKLHQGIYVEKWKDEQGEEKEFPLLDNEIGGIVNVGWIFHLLECADWDNEDAFDEYGDRIEENMHIYRMFQISLWNSEDKGFRFFLHEDKLLPFARFLRECDDYAFAHGEGI